MCIFNLDSIWVLPLFGSTLICCKLDRIFDGMTLSGLGLRDSVNELESTDSIKIEVFNKVHGFISEPEYIKDEVSQEAMPDYRGR